MKNTNSEEKTITQRLKEFFKAFSDFSGQAFALEQGVCCFAKGLGLYLNYTYELPPLFVVWAIRSQRLLSPLREQDNVYLDFSHYCLLVDFYAQTHQQFGNEETTQEENTSRESLEKLIFLFRSFIRQNCYLAEFSLYPFSLKNESNLLFFEERLADESILHRASWKLDLETYTQQINTRKSQWVETPKISVELKEAK